ncbi:MAG: helix-turn-helix domain-containing protein [Pseudohongiellaceae bacterium]|jgi:hypothetical protein
MESGTSESGLNYLLAAPSGLAVLVILLLLLFPKFRKLFFRDKLIALLLAFLLVLNSLEIALFSNFTKDYDLLIRLFCTFSTIAASVFLSVSENLNPKALFPRPLFYTILIFFNLSLIILITSTDLIITGAFKNTYSISRTLGQYYWALQIYILACILLGPALIYQSVKNSSTPLIKKRNKVILISFVPIAFTVSLVIVLMLTGFSFSLSFIFPLATLIFLIIYLHTENKDDLFKILVTVPFSSERKAYMELNDRVLNYIAMTQTDEKTSLKNLLSDIERTFITNALEIKDGDHNLAAELLSISISTVYRNKKRDN